MSSVVAFGSKFTRKVARLLESERGYKIQSLTDNVKISQFVRQLDPSNPMLDDLTILDIMAHVNYENPNYERICNSISQQHLRVMGTFHDPDTQTLSSFDDVVRGAELGPESILLMDTYNDLVFKTFKGDNSKEVYVDSQFMDSGFFEGWEEQGLEPVIEILSSLETFASYVRSYQKDVRLVLMNFAVNHIQDSEGQDRYEQLTGLIKQSAKLKELGVEFVDLPKVAEGDCADFSDNYYRLCSRLVANGCKEKSIVVVGSKELCVELSECSALVECYEQRLDVIVERDVWNSKIPCMDVQIPLQFRKPLDLTSLNSGGVIVIDLSYSLTECLKYMSLDVAGVTYNTMGVEFGKELFTLSGKKMADMITIFSEWVCANSDSVDVVVWAGCLDFAKEQLEDLFSNVTVPVLTEAWVKEGVGCTRKIIFSAKA